MLCPRSRESSNRGALSPQPEKPRKDSPPPVLAAPSTTCSIFSWLSRCGLGVRAGTPPSLARAREDWGPGCSFPRASLQRRSRGGAHAPGGPGSGVDGGMVPRMRTAAAGNGLLGTRTRQVGMRPRCEEMRHGEGHPPFHPGTLALCPKCALLQLHLHSPPPWCLLIRQPSVFMLPSQGIIFIHTNLFSLLPALP